MSAPARRMSRQQVDAEVSREVARIVETHGRPPELLGRCRICRDPESRRRVNNMLAYGMRPAEIAENLADINSRRAKNAQIGYWSVWNHRKEHFNVQEQARESQLRMLERRAEEEGLTLAEGVGSILTLKGYLEIIANKGFQNLVDRDDVGYTIGLDAQRELDKLIKADRDEVERAALRRDVALLHQVVMDEADDPTRERIRYRLAVLRGDIVETDEDVIDAEVDEDYADDDVADFSDEIDDDDELGAP